jgi:ribonuclease VapC
MFLDTSAIVEYLTEGPQAALIVDRLDSSATRRITAPTVIFEVCSVITTRKACDVPAARALLTAFLAEMEVTVVPITEETGRLAVEAFARYGKGRGHPAQLNFGDCFSYAACKLAGVPLLYIGRDFARTDLG